MSWTSMSILFLLCFQVYILFQDNRKRPSKLQPFLARYYRRRIFNKSVLGVDKSHVGNQIQHTTLTCSPTRCHTMTQAS
ncbi:Os02g0171301 [Oryza sativa Japonica Group]|uniref:Os02g0171301 protein n=1 Tax=Oryza sativa subsp. japonica TaxID=39947 RepID=A0A0P0VFE3_ORYSJ|nr:Os02g0171301 [Oryza sativa Japonica Group]